MKNNISNINNPCVSIIVPAYNVANFITSCITSLQKQTYQNIEIIVIDDGSTDTTPTIVSDICNIDHRVKLIRQKNQGTASARNAGLKEASGSYITFVDADDFLAPETISENIFFMMTDERLEWISFPVFRVDENLKPIKNSSEYGDFQPEESRVLKKEELISFFFQGKLSELCCGSIFRRIFLKDLYFPDGQYYEDSYFFTDIIYKTNYCMLSTHGGYFYLNRQDSSQHAYLNIDRMTSKINAMFDRITKFESMEPSASHKFRQMEDDMYYFLQYQQVKGNPDTKLATSHYTAQLGRKPKLRKSQKIKFAIIKILGYKFLKRIHTLFQLFR